MVAKTTSTKGKGPKLGGRLTDKIDVTLDNAIREKLISARIALLLRAPFFGNLAVRLKLVNADEWCTTAATDGRNFYYNTEFLSKLNDKEVEFLFGHEVLHNVYAHLYRVGEFRDPRLFNCAADYCVNADLVESKIGSKINPCLYDTKYNGLSAEEVYDILYANAEKINIEDLLDMLCDEHLDGEDEGESDDDGDGDGDKNKDGVSKKRPKLSKEDREAIKNDIRQAVLQAAQAAGAGNLPGGVQRLIKALTKPVVNWRELLEQQILSVIKNDYSWMKPSRRSWHMDAVLPGMIPGQQIDICIAIDTSGSIGEDDIKAFLSEVKGIMEAYDEYKIQIWCFDTEIYNHQVFTSENVKDIAEYQPLGGGGTDFMENWKYMKENEIEPKKFIMFTDGYPYNSWGDPDYCDTVFIIKGNTKAEPPFGVWAIYEKEAELAAA